MKNMLILSGLIGLTACGQVTVLFRETITLSARNNPFISGDTVNAICVGTEYTAGEFGDFLGGGGRSADPTLSVRCTVTIRGQSHECYKTSRRTDSQIPARPLAQIPCQDFVDNWRPPQDDDDDSYSPPQG